MNQEQIFQKHREIVSKHIYEMNWELGKLYGYPECCIKQYCSEQVLSIPSAYAREMKHGKMIGVLGYVPCDKCMKKLGTPSPFIGNLK